VLFVVGSSMRTAFRGLPPLLLLLLAAAWASPPAPPAVPALPSGAEIYRRTLPAVAWVHADAGRGTGWILDRRRQLLVTCAHVVGDDATVEVVFPVCRGGAVVADRAYYLEHLPELRRAGDAVRGRVLRRDRGTDLALVELESVPDGAGELRLADGPARPGDRVHMVGCRYDVDALWAYTGGVVRQAHALREGYYSGGKELAKGARVVIADAPINEGDSGGPLVDGRGDVVGVAAAVDWDARGAGLFIDAAEVRALAGLPPANAPPTDPAGSVARAVYRRGLRSLALVRGEGDARASGWLLDRERRLLVTTAEAVEKREAVEVVFPVFRGGEAVADAAAYREAPGVLKDRHALTTGVVLASDARRNLAVLELAELPETAEEARLAAAPPEPGAPLHVLSSPARLEVLWAYTAGAVRQRGRANLGRTADGPDPAVLVVQAPLTAGDGGGPVFDDEGDLVGVMTGKTGPQQQTAYCLTADEVRDFLAECRARWVPADAAGLCARAAVFVKARACDRAAADLDAALRLDPRYAPAWAERGRVAYLRGDDAGALRACGRAVELDAKSAAAHTWRAAALARLGKPKEALADGDAAVASAPDDATARAVRGDVRRRLGDLDGALADCDQAVWLDRQLPPAHLYRGSVYAAKDDYANAAADFTRALQLDPQLGEAYRRRGDVSWAKSDSAAALADYTQALALDPGDAAAQRGRGRALAARGEHDAALTAFDAALKLDPADARTYLDRGAERLLGGDADGGVADLAEAVRRDPSLAADALTAAERQARKEPPAACCALCRRTLAALRPLFDGRPEVQQALDDALAAAEAEPDLERRADKMRAALTAVRGKL
jgi:tetratricopeptide (TPR) repeat protein